MLPNPRLAGTMQGRSRQLGHLFGPNSISCPSPWNLVGTHNQRQIYEATLAEKL